MKYAYNSYPEVYYSKDVERIFGENPELPMNPVYSLQARPKEPKAPEKPNATKFYVLLISSIAVLVFSMSMLSGDNNGDGESYGWLGMIVLIPLLLTLKMETEYYVKDKEYYQKELIRYKQYVIDYPRLVKEYEEYYEKYFKKSQDEYYKKIKEMESSRYVNKYRKDQMTLYLKNREKPSFESCGKDVAKKGVSEQIFASKLKENGFSIFLNRRIPIENWYYYPDILIECDNIYIDVEIDEPYSGDDGEPIHYIMDGGTSIDCIRNRYMNDAGFEVIRFAEEQICLQTKECLSFIKSVINSIKAGKEKRDYSLGLIILKWDREQAIKMANRQYRQTYVAQKSTTQTPASFNEMAETVVPTGKTEQLTENEKKNIKSIVIRHHDLEINGEKKHCIGVVFTYKNGWANAYPLSRSNEQFKSGIKIDVESVVFEEVVNSEGEIKYHVCCREL